ncbi:MAG: cytochrome c [Holophagales bacterium]|nr:cytochrome c [Holophagales bacterium]
MELVNPVRRLHLARPKSTTASPSALISDGRLPGRLLAGCVLAGGLLTGCGGPPDAQTNERVLPPEYQALEVPEDHLADTLAIARGQSRFMVYCASCHGADGQGRPHPSAPPIGQDLTDPAWRQTTTARATFHVIREGKPGTAMIPIRIPDEDTWDLVAFVFSLSQPPLDPSATEPTAGEAAVDTASTAAEEMLPPSRPGEDTPDPRDGEPDAADRTDPEARAAPK